MATSDVQSSIAGVKGFKVAAVHAGLKKDGKLDFSLVVSETPCAAAGVFTTNQVKAAPVLVDMERIANNPAGIRAVAVNTRSANACTGQPGIENALRTAELVGQALDVPAESVLVMSTGVIGMQLPMEKIERGVQLASQQLGEDWNAIAHGIMTTDTRPKMASITVETVSGQSYSIAGICKGAGMIAPNMATMLSVVVTDAALTVDEAQSILSAVADVTYNCIVVDGDTSTNDTVLMLANGASGVSLATEEDRQNFEMALSEVCRKLAHDVVYDGEGVTKFITVRVTGAPDDESARDIANTIANSPLVKTAFFGNDANWGRIMMAAGRAGVPLVQERLSLWFAPGEVYQVTPDALQLVEGGTPTGFDEAHSTAIVKEPKVSVLLDCGIGDGAATIWTCDLSHEYVSINGDYRS